MLYVLILHLPDLFRTSRFRVKTGIGHGHYGQYTVTVQVIHPATSGQWLRSQTDNCPDAPLHKFPKVITIKT